MRVTRRVRRHLVLPLAAVLLAGLCAAAPRNTVTLRAVFLGDSYTAGHGIAPLDDSALLCLWARENVPAVVVDQLADRAVEVTVQADVSCAGAAIDHVWLPQDLGGGLSAEPQKKALRKDTRLVVGSLGLHTLGFGRVLKQCSARLRGHEGAMLPGAPLDARSTAGECRAHLEDGPGAAWLAERFTDAAEDLEKLFSEIDSESPEARVVLVGYPRWVPADPAACRAAVPDGTETPFADLPADALPFLDRAVQAPLNALMRDTAHAHGAHFVDLYAETGGTTACAGRERWHGALLEESRVTLFHHAVPWLLHPTEDGRDHLGDLVADAVAGLYGR
ncbi:SGNH/GDSL hydrolase family protein [Streptomyces sp. CC77]|uniref:SGNH/GDSL hydrolase family protein n=1 Tax=Streptomyces sp. CC77 TaxID=1906739 RepID=UPI0008DCB847|nr:SGNH/GDSL hydrolase family protein [Streptomyces sp. CC77]OII68754.1 hypothetical protein BJP39_20140 [Streptomyces sp. CC77]